MKRNTWQQMLNQSFDPKDWFADDRSPNSPEGHEIYGGGIEKMWVYRKVEDSGRTFYEVGFYDPQGEWHCDTIHDSRTEAAERTRRMNGGS